MLWVSLVSLRLLPTECAPLSPLTQTHKRAARKRGPGSEKHLCTLCALHALPTWRSIACVRHKRAAEPKIVGHCAGRSVGPFRVVIQQQHIASSGETMRFRALSSEQPHCCWQRQLIYIRDIPARARPIPLYMCTSHINSRFF